MALTFNQINIGGLTNFRGMAVSSSGSKIMLGTAYIGKLYYSSDYGTTWVERSVPKNHTNVIIGNSDFSKMFIDQQDAITHKHHFYYSTDQFETYTESGSGYDYGVTDRSETRIGDTGEYFVYTTNDKKIFYDDFSGERVQVTSDATLLLTCAFKLDAGATGEVLYSTNFNGVYIKDAPSGTPVSFLAPAVKDYGNITYMDGHYIVSFRNGRCWIYNSDNTTWYELRPKGDANGYYYPCSTNLRTSKRTLFLITASSSDGIWINTNALSNLASTTFEKLVTVNASQCCMSDCFGDTAFDNYPTVVMYNTGGKVYLAQTNLPPDGIPLKIHNGATWDEAVSLKVRGESGWTTPVSVKAYNGDDWEDVAV